MRTLFSLLFVLTVQHIAFAQSSDPAREAADRLILKYNLDTQQAEKAYAIQVRKLKNMAEIEAFASSAPALFRAKKTSIQQGTQASIGRLLTTKSQRALYRQTLSEQRKLRAEKRLAMEAKGEPEATIEAAMLDIYME